MIVAQRAEQLMAVAKKQNSITALTDEVMIPRPETSLAASSLFTGSKYEPSMMDEFRKEICSADRIDILVSFVKWSGLRLIINELTDFVQRGGQLRVITTSYMGATDARAVEIKPLSVFAEYIYSYPAKDIAFTFIEAEIVSGEPLLCVHEEMRWVLPSELRLFEWCPADMKIAQMLV